MSFFNYKLDEVAVNWALAPEEVKNDYRKRVKRREFRRSIRTALFLVSLIAGVGGLLIFPCNFLPRDIFEIWLFVAVLPASILVGYLFSHNWVFDKWNIERWDRYIGQLEQKYPYPDRAERLKIHYQETISLWEKKLGLKRT